MLSNALLVLSYVIILFVLIGIGVVANKIKLISSNGIKDLTNVVLYIVTPCVLINSYQREFNEEMLMGLGITVLASVISFALNILISHLLIHDKDKRREKTLIFGSVFSNCGFMSLPLQEAILGSEGVFYGATYVAVFQILIWTYGVIE
ncbi:MAG: AEC family transporter, partial [Clostridia bacterium]|nr:AEC family transporter [Clostridia bacterium]